MCTRKTSLSLLLFFVSIIYFTIRKVNPLCEKNVLFAGRSSQNHASWTCYVYHHLFAAGRPSRVGPYAQGRWPCFLRIAELWQPTFISSPVCDIVGDAQRAYRYGDSAMLCRENAICRPRSGRFLRAESYSNRCCRFEFVAAQRHP